EQHPLGANLRARGGGQRGRLPGLAACELRQRRPHPDRWGAAQGTNGLVRVDVHTHYLPPALVRALERRTELPRMTEGPGGRQIEYGQGNIHPYLPNMGDIELRLREMDEQDIDLAVLSINIPGVDWFPVSDGPAVAREVNDELADLVEQYPDRFVALATLPMQAPEAAAAELER